MSEKILVFPKKQMSGFSSDLLNNRISLSEDDIIYFENECLDTSFFAIRTAAEEDPNLKQVIPYGVIRSIEGKILTYRRTKTSGEGRLHNKASVGIGGHINQDDMWNDPFAAVNIGLARELSEELVWPIGHIEDYTLEYSGVIYDDYSDVGRVHFGLLVEIWLADEWDLKPNEDSISEVKWMTPHAALELENLEDWSKIVLQEIIKRDTICA